MKVVMVVMRLMVMLLMIDFRLSGFGDGWIGEQTDRNW